MKKTVKIVSSVLSWILLAATALILVALVMTKVSGGEPELFGFRLFVVSSGSMEPTLHVGDVILSGKFAPGDALEAGDILTYRGSGQMEGKYVTHRLTSAEGEPGSRTLTLQGDANNVPDAPMSEDRVVAKEICKLRILTFFYSHPFFAVLLMFLLIILVAVCGFLDYFQAIRNTGTEEKEKNGKSNDGE